MILTFLGRNGTRFALRHFRAQRSLDFQSPPFPMALEKDLPASKSLHPALYKQEVHLEILDQLVNQLTEAGR